MPGAWLALKQAQHILDRINQRPVELKQLAAGAAREDELRQRSAGRATLGQLAAKLCKRDSLVAGDLSEAGLQRDKGIGIGENLSGLLQGLVLIDRNQRRRRSAVASYQHMVAAVADIIKQAAEIAA